MATTSEQIKALLDDINRGECKKNYNFSKSNIGIKEIDEIARVLSSGRCPRRFTLNLKNNKLGPAEIKLLAEALQSGNCPRGLTLYLGDNDLGLEGAKLLAEALQSGKCPMGLKLELGRNNLDPAAAKLFAEALQSGNCPPGLTLDFGGGGVFFGNNLLGPAGANLFAEALQSKMCPYMVVINGIAWPNGKSGQAAKAKVTFGEAWHYEHGVGVRYSLKVALELYEQALALGHVEAQQEITRLKKALKPKPLSVNSQETKQSGESNRLRELPPTKTVKFGQPTVSQRGAQTTTFERHRDSQKPSVDPRDDEEAVKPGTTTDVREKKVDAEDAERGQAPTFVTRIEPMRFQRSLQVQADVAVFRGEQKTALPTRIRKNRKALLEGNQAVLRAFERVQEVQEPEAIPLAERSKCCLIQ